MGWMLEKTISIFDEHGIDIGYGYAYKLIVNKWYSFHLFFMIL